LEEISRILKENQRNPEDLKGFPMAGEDFQMAGEDSGGLGRISASQPARGLVEFIEFP